MKDALKDLYIEYQDKEIEFAEKRKKFNMLLKTRNIDRDYSNEIDYYLNAKIFYALYSKTFDTDSYKENSEKTFDEYKIDLMADYNLEEDEATEVVNRHYVYDECGYIDVNRTEDEKELLNSKINFFISRAEFLEPVKSVVNKGTKRLIRTLQVVESKTNKQ